MKLISGPALGVIIFLAVLALLIFIVWLFGEFRKKKYHDQVVEYMQQSERTPVLLTTWGEISDAAENGVMTCRASSDLEGLTDQVQLTLYGKDKSAIESFTQNVKFRFSPIYSQPPADVFQSLRMKTQRTPVAKSSKDTALLSEAIVLEADDLLLEFGMQIERPPAVSTKKSRVASQNENRPYFAVGFNIDPTIRRIHAVGRCPTPITCGCNRKNYYYSKEKNIRVTISVTVGEVDATLGSTSIVKAGQSATKSPSNPNGDVKTLSIGGRALNDNTYGLTGTWNV